MNFGFDKPTGYYEARLIELQKQIDSLRRENRLLAEQRSDAQSTVRKLRNKINPMAHIMNIANLVMEQLQDDAYGDDLEALEAKDRDAYIILDALQDTLTSARVDHELKMWAYKKGPKTHPKDSAEYGYPEVWEAYIAPVGIEESVQAYENAVEEAKLLGYGDKPPGTPKATLTGLDAIIQENYKPMMEEHMKEHTTFWKAYIETENKAITEEELKKLMDEVSGVPPYTKGPHPSYPSNHSHGIAADLSGGYQAASILGMPLIVNKTLPENHLMFVHDTAPSEKWFVNLPLGDFLAAKGAPITPKKFRELFEAAAHNVPWSPNHVEVNLEMFNLIKIAYSF